MTDSAPSDTRLILGDPVPWFSSQLVTGGGFDLHVSAGRWVVLAFLGDPADPRVSVELNALLSHADLFKEDHIIVGCVCTRPPDNIEDLARITSNALFFIADYDGAISGRYGAAGQPRTVVLDSMLRAIADVAWDAPQGHAATIGSILRSLPSVDDSAGVPMVPPALLLPRAFGFDLCDFLVQFYEQQGGKESGFQFDVAGKTTTLLEWRLKRRSDVPVIAPEVYDLVRGHVARRLAPAIERFFQFKVTRIDRCIVACYDSAVGAHFHRHRDNVNAGAQHRRFALSINLNKDFEGGDLVFPEFGSKRYRIPEGGAMVFSCGALHEVTPVTRGRRYAFLAFLYGEEDVRTRLANNARLHPGEVQYTGQSDRIFPEAAAPSLVPADA
ncbi:MAG: 2OG-Fe(II) oxygenase [Xanthobacteraceae bacterium]|nr:2OG-Fe(II) oxygenase [Xanthobacteraceae bacterium]